MEVKRLLLCLFTISALRVVAEASLVSNTSVACPGEAVLFTCSSTATLLQWRVDAPAPVGSNVTSFESSIFLPSTGTDVRRNTFGSGVIMLEAVLVSSDGGTLTSTLINLSEVSVLDDSNVTCTVTNNSGGLIESQQTVIVAVAPTSPLNLRVPSTQNQLSSSIITLDWDSPSSTGGVSVSYVLTISPTPLSGSLVTMETTSAQIVLYNTPYNVTIRAVNCAGSSSDVMITIPSIPPELTCGSPVAPSRGSVDISGGTPPFSLGSEVIYRCEEELFPLDVRTSTCTDVGGRGEWVENPGSLVCRERPVNCSLPEQPSNGTIVKYDRLNQTVFEGTVLTYQCDNGLSLTGPNTITCTNAGVWSTEPEEIMCVLMTEAPSTDFGATIGGIVGGILVLVCLIVIVVIAMFLLKRNKSDKFREDLVEMSGLQGDYNELRHDGPRESNRAQPPPADSEGYSRVNRNPDAGALTYDEVVLNSGNITVVNSEGYSVMNTGQTQRLPGYGQLGNVATVEPVVYAALSTSQPRKKGTATVDHHQVTYATVDSDATRKQEAMAAILPTASAPADVDKLLDIDQALVQIRSMKHKWKELAETMRVQETMIEQIEDSCGVNHGGCLTEVIDQWMRSCSGRPTWRELAGHLHNIGEEQLSQELMTIYDTGRLPVELNMKAVPSTVYKYDRAPPPPLPSRSPTTTDDSPGLPKLPSRPPKAAGAAMVPARPPKPAHNNEPPVPARPSKQYVKH